MIRRLLSTGLALALAPSTSAAQFEVGDFFPRTPFLEAESGALAGVDAYLGEPLLLHVYASW